MTKYIQRRQFGIDMNVQGLDVHVAGGHINNHSKRVRCEVDEKTELELHVSRVRGVVTWIVYKYYSPTQAKTRDSKKCPSKYAEIGEKLESIFAEVFAEEKVEEL